MIERASSAASVAIHVFVIALLAMTTVKAPQDSKPENGMEFEIVDFEYAMPSMSRVLPSPTEVQQQDDATRSPQRSATSAMMEQPQASIASMPIPPLRRPKFEKVAVAPVSVPSLGPGPQQPVVAIRPARAVTAQAPVDAGRSIPVETAGPPRLNASELSRSIGSGEARPQRARINSAALGTAIGEAAPRGVPGLTLRQRADLAAMVRSQVIPCWNPPPPDNAASAVVSLRFRLDRDGRVIGKPAVSGQFDEQSPYLNLLANSARRAILLCAPLDLPSELYDAWAEVEVEFDPRDL